MKLEIKVVQGSILEAEAEVIVNAANSLGIMGGGVAGIIKRAAGQDVEDEARRAAPIPIGHAVLTSGGRTKFKGIIHAPTMTQPAMRIPSDHVAKATRGALALADERGIASLALPGMGTGVGGVAHAEAARKMIDAIRAFAPRSLKTVILVDVDSHMIEAWREAMGDRQEKMDSRPSPCPLPGFVMPLEDDFSDIVKKARMGQGLSVGQVAEAAGLAERDVSALERGQPPDRTRAQALAKALALRPDALTTVGVEGWTPDPTSSETEGVLTVHGDIGGYAVKGYILYDQATRRAMLIDTGYNPDAALELLDRRGLELIAVGLTHGHHDHAGGLDRILERRPVPVYLGAEDLTLLAWRPRRDLLIMIGEQDRSHAIQMGAVTIRMIPTPGHTPGGLCFLARSGGRDLCFVGDTLFAGSIGRSNPFSLYPRHLQSVRTQILTLPAACLLLPGHGPATTVKEELAHNPFAAV